MTGHIGYTDPALAAVEVPEEWLPAGAALREYLNALALRSDLVVTVAPGAGEGNPAFFQPSTAEIRIDSTVCLPGTMAGDVHLSDRLWRLEHPVLIGAAGHEAGHAAHTRWVPAEFEAVGVTPKLMDVIMLLEEPRCEHRLLSRARGQKPFLRAAALELIMSDFELPRTAYGAAASAALVLARVDGGTLDKADGAEVRRMIGTVLPAGTVAELEQLWQEFLGIGDRNLPGMYSVAKRWLRAIAEDPNDTVGMIFPGQHGGVPQPQQNGQQPQQADTGWLRKALGGAAVRADGSIVEARSAERGKRRAVAAAADADRRQRSERAAEAAFGVGSGPGGASAGRTGERPPTADEQRAATELSARLMLAEQRELPDVERSSRQKPPGRLRTRAAAQAAAYTALDIRSKPELFRSREHVPDARSPLSIAVLLDRSGSMMNAAEAVSSTHWVLSHAGSRIGARVAAVQFGVQVYGVARPGQLHEQVQEYRASDPWENFTDAFLAADHELQLLDGRGARMLVVASDGQYGRDPQRAFAQAAMTLCRERGVAVLWLRFTHHDVRTYGYGTVLDVRGDAPVETARTVGDAAVRLLQQMQ